jgi:hypothetical protein
MRGGQNVNITPDILHWAYEYLRHTPPFRRWGLPEADEVEFHVTRSQEARGHCQQAGAAGAAVIAVSQALVVRTQRLIETVAHEMIHLYLDRRGVKSAHGAEFKKCAAAVCREHGFDPGDF